MWHTLRHAYCHLQGTMLLQHAIQQAEEQHARTHQRHYVLPAAPLSGTLVIFNRKTFRYYRQRHYINATMHVSDMRQLAYYYTADGNNQDPMPQEQQQRQRQAFLRWHHRCQQLQHTTTTHHHHA